MYEPYQSAYGGATALKLPLYVSLMMNAICCIPLIIVSQLSCSCWICLDRSHDFTQHAEEQVSRSWHTGGLSHILNGSDSVSLQGVTSSPRPLDIGVPQGSVLGPYSFLPLQTLLVYMASVSNCMLTTICRLVLENQNLCCG